MKIKWTMCLVIVFLLAMLALDGHAGSADPTPDELRQLLQKSLTVYELDQEIARLTVREQNLSEQLSSLEQQMSTIAAEMEITRERAGRVLRAYYMGDRPQFWMMLLSADSLSDLLTMYDYMSLMVSNDRRVLSAHAETYDKLELAKAELEATRAALGEIKQLFIVRRDEMLKLQQEIDEQVAQSEYGDQLQQEIERFTKEWEEVGIPLLRKYVAGIVLAMENVPELLTGENASKYVKSANLLSRTMKFEISDTDLTAFFHAKNPELQNLQLQFDDGLFIASGKEGDLEATIKGRYVISNDPVNHLEFIVEELIYQGFILPETSNQALQEEFGMGFVPSEFIPNLSVTEIRMDDGKMGLSLSFR